MIYAFDQCILDTERQTLTRDGRNIHVEPQVFALIELLLGAAGSIVTKDRIVEVVWQGRIVSEATISARINSARVAVGDTGRDQKIIRTVTKRGLEMVVPVERMGPDVTTKTAPEAEHPNISDMPCEVNYASSADGSALAWTVAGEGPPILRAGHWLTHIELDRVNLIWKAWIDRMGRGRQLVRYDVRGTGLSDWSSSDFSFDNCINDMAAVVDAAGLHDFDVFSASQATAVTLGYAHRYPGRIRRIVSYGGWPQGAARRADGDRAHMTDALANMIKMGWGQPEGGFMRAFASMFIPQANDDQVRAFVELQTNSTTGERAAAMREVLAQFDVTDILPEIETPTLVLHARGDNLHPFSQAQMLARLMPNAKLRMLESQNHILMPDEPAFGQLFDALDEFLA